MHYFTSCIPLWRQNIMCMHFQPVKKKKKHPHEIALLQKHTRIASFWPTVHMDPKKQESLKTHFFENGSQGGEIRKHSPRAFMWTANPHTFQNDDAIAPPLNL